MTGRAIAFSLGLVLCVQGLSETYKFKPVVTGGGGGFIVDVIFHPTEKDLIYAKTDMGGAYRWDNATSKWTQLFKWLSTDEWNWSGMEGMAIDPQDPNRLYVAGGTYTNDWTSSNGAMFRSADRGASWNRTDMPFKMGGNMPGRGMGERLVVDPNLGNIVYFGARNGMGLWKSTDYGATWSNVSSFPDMGKYRPSNSSTYLGQLIGIPWIIFNKTSGTKGTATPVIYAGVATNGGNASNIYVSKDAGSTWSEVPGQVKCWGSWGSTVRCTDGNSWTAGAAEAYSGGGIGYLPKNAKIDSEGTLYVTYSDWEGPYLGSTGAVFKYKDGIWNDITPCNSNNTYCSLKSLYYGFGGIGVDPQKPGTVMVAGVNSWWPDGVMFRTTNGGSSWTPAWTYKNSSSSERVKVFSMNVSNAPWLRYGDSISSVGIGHMMENIAIDPFNSNRMMYGTGATLFATDNLGNWDSGSGVVIRVNALGIEEGSVLGIISPSAGAKAHLYSLYGDISGFRHVDLDSAPTDMWQVPYAGGSYNSIDYAEKNPLFIVRAGSPSGTVATGWTYDGGDTWYAAASDPFSWASGGNIAASATGDRVVWSPSWGTVSWTDNGTSWSSSSGIPSAAVVCSDRVNQKRFYGFSSGKFYYSTDAGVSFNVSSASGLPSSGTMRAAFGQEGHVWVAGGLSSGLWHTTDGGLTFTKLSNIAGAAVVGFGKAAPGKDYPAIFVSGRITNVSVPGIYRSDDAGESWIEISDPENLYCTIQCITGDPQIYGRVYFGTNGFGLVYGDTTSSVSSADTVSSAASPIVSSAYLAASSAKDTISSVPVKSESSSPNVGTVSSSHQEKVSSASVAAMELALTVVLCGLLAFVA